MATEVRIPALAVTMTEGVLVEWLAGEGETVRAGQDIYLLESDKTEMAIEAPVAGVLHHVVEAGGTYEVGTLIAEIS